MRHDSGFVVSDYAEVSKLWRDELGTRTEMKIGNRWENGHRSTRLEIVGPASNFTPGWRYSLSVLNVCKRCCRNCGPSGASANLARLWCLVKIERQFSTGARFVLESRANLAYVYLAPMPKFGLTPRFPDGICVSVLVSTNKLCMTGELGHFFLDRELEQWSCGTNRWQTGSRPWLWQSDCSPRSEIPRSIVCPSILISCCCIFKYDETVIAVEIITVTTLEPWHLPF